MVREQVWDEEGQMKKRRRRRGQKEEEKEEDKEEEREEEEAKREERREKERKREEERVGGANRDRSERIHYNEIYTIRTPFERIETTETEVNFGPYNDQRIMIVR